MITILKLRELFSGLLQELCNRQIQMIKTYLKCEICGGSAPLFSGVLGVCPACARTTASVPQSKRVHACSRRLFGLPETSPRDLYGMQCKLCARECQIGERSKGYCGLREVTDGRLRHLAGTPKRGLLHWYRDPLPTNCVADWLCSGTSQISKHNLAVFYASCTLDCLYCQNWHFREADPQMDKGISARNLAGHVNSNTYCVCYFGGDPASQMPHALASARFLSDRGMVVCWETAGTANPRLMDRAVALSLGSGGCVKFDLKAFSEPLHIALTGFSNQMILANFARAVERFRQRPDPPLIVASTLLVPGYVDAEEVERIATFIASLEPGIPYALLGFSPNYLMPDLPPTSVHHAETAFEAATAAGLRNVKIGNRHLLGRDY